MEPYPHSHKYLHGTVLNKAQGLHLYVANSDVLMYSGAFKTFNVIPPQQSSQQIHSSVTESALALSMTCSNPPFIGTQLSYSLYIIL